MFGIAEMGLLLAVAIIVIGPDHLPELARTWGTTFFRIKRGIDSARQEMNAVIDADVAPELPLTPPLESPEASSVAPRE